jgi:hypothetical protein
VDAKWFVRVGGRVYGPRTAAELRQLAKTGKIGRDAEIGGSEAGPWHVAASVKGLFPQSVSVAGAAAPPPLPPPAAAPRVAVSTPPGAAAATAVRATAASADQRAYRHSGVVPPAGAVASIAGGMIVALVSSLIYTMFIVWVPYIYFNVIATACFGGLVGLSVGWASKLGHVRNPLFVTLVAVACAVVGIYAEWAYTPSVLIDSSIGLAGFSPASVLMMIGLLYEKGSWGLFGFQVNGMLLVLVWIIECLVVVFCSVVGSRVLTAEQPYCESCRAWTITRKGVNHVGAARDTNVRERVIAGDLRLLDSLPKSNATTPLHWRLDIASCPRCPSAHYLSVHEVTITVGENKEQKENSDVVTPPLRLEPAEVEFVTSCGRQPPPDAAWQGVEDAMADDVAD